MFINAVGTDPKLVTVTFYEAKLALLGKITAGEKTSCCNRVHQLAKEGDRSGKAGIAQEIVKDVKARGVAALNKKHGLKSTKMWGGGNVKH